MGKTKSIVNEKEEGQRVINIPEGIYSTHQRIRYTPRFSMHSYGATCLT